MIAGTLVVVEPEPIDFVLATVINDMVVVSSSIVKCKLDNTTRDGEEVMLSIATSYMISLHLFSWHRRCISSV